MTTEQKWPTFVFENPYTGRQDSFEAEEWVKGWTPGGEVYGDPVIRIFKSGQPTGDKKIFCVVRAYHVQKEGGTNAHDENNNPIVVFQSVIIQPSPRIIDGEMYHLVPVLKSRLTATDKGTATKTDKGTTK